MGEWLTTMKPNFLTEWSALPNKENHQIHEKIRLLCQDPHPDAKVKKRIKGWEGKIYRIRSGNYRIFYTFEEPYISLLALRKKKVTGETDETYEDQIDAELLGGYNPELPSTQNSTEWIKHPLPDGKNLTYLPEKITEELLKNLKIPEEYWRTLIRVKTREELLDECLEVPDEIFMKIDNCLFERPIELVMNQPSFLAQNTDDLLKFKGQSCHQFFQTLWISQMRVFQAKSSRF